jgi:hypothetical protein
MADRAFPRTAYTQGTEIGGLFVAGQEAEFLFGQGTQILPTLGAEIYGRTATRIVLDADERWFEMGFQMDHLLSGNAATGWTDAGNYFRLEAQWSLDLVSWAMGKFIPAPVPVVDLGGGLYEYWARAIHPVDSAVKSGQIGTYSGQYGNGIPGAFSSDPRNNPLTALTVAGVSLALGGFPYTMPTDAAKMQADLRVFYPLATVTATSDVIWEIVIPGVAMTQFNQLNKVSWPGYLVQDMFGNLTITVDGAYLAGAMVDGAGTPIHQRAFGRLKISPGSRYAGWH